MGVTELKNKLHASIAKIDDSELLASVYDILEKGNKLPAGLLADEAFLNKLELGMADIENGHVLSLKESNSQIDEWLTK
jgi:predicted transcriptional regulator